MNTYDVRDRDQIVARLASDHLFTSDFAEKVFEQTLTFLIASAQHPEQQLVPSPMIDKGWHTFLLFTESYVDFCQRFVGNFIHHRPTTGDTAGSGWDCRDTFLFLQEKGYDVESKMWKAANGASCKRGCAEVIPPLDIMSFFTG